jgi:hypothetical protein
MRRTLSRRRAIVTTLGSQLRSLWRRWSATDWILDRLREWRSQPKKRPMFPRGQLTVSQLEDRFYPNYPLNLLQSPLLGSLSILGSSIL